MKIRGFGLSIIAALLSVSVFANAAPMQTPHPCQVNDDSALVAAFKSHKTVFYVEGGDLTVTALLPDDTTGLPHQKWQTKLSDGSMISIIYNSDMGDRVPVKVGDKFSVGGQYIPTGKTGLVHWLHSDPKHKRPDGYVCADNVVYGDSGGSEAH